MPVAIQTSSKTGKGDVVGGLCVRVCGREHVDIYVYILELWARQSRAMKISGKQTLIQTNV